MRESKVEAHFKARVEETGGMTRKTQWIGRIGCPDRWCGWPSGKSAWVELKGDGGRLAVHQEREIMRLRLCKQRVEVLHSIQEVDVFIEEMSRED